MKITELKKSRTLLIEADSVYAVANDTDLDAAIIKNEGRMDYLSFSHPKYKEKQDTKWRYGREWKDDPANAQRLLSGGQTDEIAESMIENAHIPDAEMNRTVQNVQRRRRRRNEYDGDLDIDAVLDGNPMYYSKVSRVNTKKRVKRVILNISANAGVSERQISAGIAKSVARILLMMKESYLVEVYATYISQNIYSGSSDFNNAVVCVRIKEANKPMDEQRLKTSVYPAMLRYFMFRSAFYGSKYMVEKLDQKSARTTGGLGQPTNTQQNPGLLKDILKDLANTVFGSTDQVEYLDLFNNAGKESFDWTK